MCKVLDFNSRKKTVAYMESVVFGTFVRYFKDLNDSSKVSIPYFIEARNLYRERVRSLKDLKELYNKIQQNTRRK